MPTSTVPPTPAAAGGGSEARARSPGGHARARAGPTHSLLACIQFSFVKHPAISDLHQAFNHNCQDALDAEADIDALFTSAERTDVKSDGESTKAARRTPVEKIISPHAIETVSDARMWV